MYSNYIKKIVLVAFCISLVAWSVPEKTKVFLIGDSISVQYFQYLKEYMAPFADVDRKSDNGQAEINLDVPSGANGGDSRMVLEYLRSKFNDPEFKPDYMLINCGLHDIKRTPEKPEIVQVTEENYRKNLESIFTLLKSHKVKPVWVRTTYVVDSIHNSRSKDIVRHGEDVVKYNKIADEICAKNHVPSIDLYSFSVSQGKEHIMDHVHYDQPTRALQAAYITGFMQNILSNQKR